MNIRLRLNAVKHEWIEPLPELDVLLRNSYVRIDWYGQRIIYFTHYQGYVTINELAACYLSKQHLAKTLPEKLLSYHIWQGLEDAYMNTDRLLTQMYLYRYLVPAKEFRPYCRACGGDPMARILGMDGQGPSDALCFTPEEFKSYWPHEEPVNKVMICAKGVVRQEWFATYEMVVTSVGIGIR